MAQVNIQIGNIQVGLEDEDYSAKSLSKHAMKVLDQVIEHVRPLEEESDEEDEDDG